MNPHTPMLAADHIRDLVKGFTTYEHVTQPRQSKDGTWRPERRIHTVTHKPLLDQLEDAITGASARADEDANRGTFQSKPAARLEALDVLARIDRESLNLAVDLDLHAPPRTITRIKVKPLRARLLAISGKIGDRPDHQIHSWWVAARLATQWDSRPYQPPRTPCPNCWATKTLRIDLTNDLARCTDCHQTWDGKSPVAVLAQHVKWCTEHEVTKPRHWLLDPDGYPTECTECLTFRQELAVRRAHTAQVLDNVTSRGA